MRLLLCLDGTNTEQLLGLVVSALRLDGAALRLLHVLDARTAEEAGWLRGRYVGSGGMGSHWRTQLDRASLAGGEALLQGAADCLAALLAAPGAHGVATASVERVLVVGRPEQEIVAAAREWPADLVALCARRQDSAPPPPGPHSLGHVARFVTDHAPCPVLLKRP